MVLYYLSAVIGNYFMKLCFLIQCHRFSPSLEYTVNKILADENSNILIHVDKKSNLEEFEKLNLDRVTFIKNRINVSWGAVSQIEVAIKLLSEAEKLGFDYASFISGDDVLIKSVEEFKYYLSKNGDLEYLGIDHVVPYEKILERVAYRYPTCFYDRSGSISSKILIKFYSTLFKLGFLKNKKSIKYPRLYKGSNWFTISINLTRYILDELRNEPSLISFFEDSLCCDEVLFQTIVMNSKYKGKLNMGPDDNYASLRYINWIDGPEYPKVLNINDLRSNFDESIFFIRKVNPSISVSCIAELFG